MENQTNNADVITESAETTGYENITKSEYLPVDDVAKRHEDALYFTKLALPCLLYALMTVIFMYDNHGAVTTPLWIASVDVLVVYLVSASGRDLKKGSAFIITAMLLIAISSFVTGNSDILLMNYVAEFMLLVSLVLHNYADDSKWDFGKCFMEIFVAVISAAIRVFNPFTDGAAFVKEHKGDKNTRLRQIIVGVLIAIPCLLILGALLSSADMVFATLLSNLLENINIADDFFGITFLFVFAFLSSYCGMRYVMTSADKIAVADRRKGAPIIAITITIMIAALYLVFSIIQIMYVFIGGFELPDGVTYAEYARSGFFQLLFVCIINLILVLSMKKYICRSQILDTVLLVISGCTYIMIASSASRMIMYIKAYHLTFTRVFVLVALLTLAVLLVGVIIAIINEKFSFFRYGTVVISVIYITFAFSHADYYIARYNLNKCDVTRLESTSYLDYHYISELSTDAAPAIMDYLDEQGISKTEMYEYEWVKSYCTGNYKDMDGSKSIREFNISHYRAEKLFGKMPSLNELWFD